MTTDCESYGMFVTPKENKFWEEIAIAQKEVEIATAQGKLAMVTFRHGMDGEMHPVAAIMEVKPKKATKDTLFMFWLSMVMLAMTTVGFVAHFLGMF